MCPWPKLRPVHARININKMTWVEIKSTTSWIGEKIRRKYKEK